MTPTSILRALLALALLTPAAAHAAPPEGCVGFPAIPKAYVCVTQWTPENAPSVAPGPGQTVVIPEFCVFQCVGPTPVTIPSFVVNPGNGAIAVVQYDGQTYTVAVPPAPDPNALIQQVVTTVTGLVQQVVTIATGAVETVNEVVSQAGRTRGVFTGNAYINCFGCGGSSGQFDASFTGSINGHAYSGAAMHADFSFDAGSGFSCILTSTASGTVWVGSDSASFTWTHVGMTAVWTFSDGFTASGVSASFLSGATCGAALVFSFAGALAGS